MDFNGIVKDKCDHISFSPFGGMEDLLFPSAKSFLTSYPLLYASLLPLGQDIPRYVTLLTAFTNWLSLWAPATFLVTSDQVSHLQRYPQTSSPPTPHSEDLFLIVSNFSLALLVFLSSKNPCYIFSLRQRSTESTFSLSWERERGKYRQEKKSDFNSLPAIVLWSVAMFSPS